MCLVRRSLVESIYSTPAAEDSFNLALILQTQTESELISMLLVIKHEVMTGPSGT